MKETMNTLKTLASDNSSKEILDFWNEESQRQAAKDDAFFENNDCISSTATSLNYVTSHPSYAWTSQSVSI